MKTMLNLYYMEDYMRDYMDYIKQYAKYAKWIRRRRTMMQPHLIVLPPPAPHR